MHVTSSDLRVQGLANTDTFKASLGRLTTKHDVVTMSGKWLRIYDVLKMSDLHCHEDVQFTTSWKFLIYDFFWTSDFQHPEDIWFMSPRRHPICDVLKTSNLKCLEDVPFTISWRCVTYDILETSDLWHLEDVCKTIFV